MEERLNLTLEFSGGAEQLFGNSKKHEVQLPANESCKEIDL